MTIPHPDWQPKWPNNLPDTCAACLKPFEPGHIPLIARDYPVCDPCYDAWMEERFGGPEQRKRLLFCPACRWYIDPMIERISMVSEMGKGTRIRHGMTPESVRDHPFADYEWADFKTLPERTNAD